MLGHVSSCYARLGQVMPGTATLVYVSQG